MAKKVLIFITLLLSGILLTIFYKLLSTHPNEPIKSIVQTVTKPSFDIAIAPKDTTKGNITQMSGDIFWQSRVATQDAQINEKIMLQQGESIRTGEDGNLTLEFPNLSQIKIYPATQIDLIQTLPVNFVVNIASGSAQFKKTTNNPVSIRAAHLLINQNSGNVSIGINKDEKKGIFINLNIIEGQITLAYNDKDLISHVMNINAPQRITFNDTKREFE